MKRLLVGLIVFATWLVTVAASGGSSSTAIAIAAIAGTILPLVLKYIPAAGHYMVGITLGVSLLIAVLAEMASGELVLTNLRTADATSILALFLSVWGLSQIVYAALTQSPKTAPLVT